MSLHVSSWVFRCSDESTPGRRLILLVLADHAHDDGTGAYPSVKTIAEKARMTERGVQYALRALEESGAIRREGLGPKGTVSYTIAMGGEQSSGCNLRQEGVQSETDIVSPIAPEPSLEPSKNRPSRGQTASGPIERVFKQWTASVGKPSSVLDLKRRRLIGNALKTFPEADLLDAVRGWKNSAHHRGENDRHEIYNDVELLLRDAKHVEFFRDKFRGGGSSGSSLAGVRL